MMMLTNDDYINKQRKLIKDWSQDVLILEKKMNEMRVIIEKRCRDSFTLISSGKNDKTRKTLKFPGAVKQEPDIPV
jgi:hypothetical protein